MEGEKAVAWLKGIFLLLIMLLVINLYGVLKFRSYYEDTYKTEHAGAVSHDVLP